MPLLPVPGGSSRQQYQAFPFQIHLPVTARPSHELLLAAGSAIAVPLQHHSRAQGTQCKDPLGCFNCLKLTTLQRAVTVFVSVEEHLLLEPCYACRPSCESKYYWDQEANNFNFSVRLHLYFPEPLCIISKVCHFPLRSFSSAHL